MLPVDKIYPGISQAESKGLLRELQNIYDGFPETKCGDCTSCCSIPTPGYLIEYLNMYKYLRDNLQNRMPEIMERIIRYFYLEMVDVNLNCPFLDEAEGCLVRPVRPLTCRTHGLVDNINDDSNNARMKMLAKQYKEKHDIELPEEVINFKLPACPENKNKGMSINTQLAQGISDVAKLESELFSRELTETEYTFIPFATHLALSVLSEGARARRYKVMKEYLDSGESKSLEGFVEKFKNHRF